MLYINFIFQDLTHFAECLVFIGLLLYFLLALVDRFITLVHVLRFPVQHEEGLQAKQQTARE